MSEQKFKVGDIVKGLGFERGVVVDNNNYLSYPLKVDFGNTYIRLTSDGKYHKDSPHPAMELVERPKKKIKKIYYKFYHKHPDYYVIYETNWYTSEAMFRAKHGKYDEIIKVEEKEFEIDEKVL